MNRTLRELTSLIGVIIALSSMLWSNANAQFTLPITLECNELARTDGNKGVNCRVKDFSLILPSAATIPTGPQTSAISFAAPTNSLSCSPNATVVGSAAGSTASTLTGNCTNDAGATYLWGGVQLPFSFVDATAKNTATTPFNMPSTTQTIPLTLRVCLPGMATSACPVYNASIQNPDYQQQTGAPAGCSLGGVTNGQSVNPGSTLTPTTGCTQNVSGNTNYAVLFNGQPVSLPHEPFKTGGTNTTGTYTGRACNGSACIEFPASGITVNRASTGTGLALCPSGTAVQASIDFNTTTYALWKINRASNQPVVLRVTVPAGVSAAQSPAHIEWNTVNGAFTGKRITIGQRACDTTNAVISSIAAEGGSDIYYSATPTSPANKLTPGEWYLTVTSPNCSSTSTSCGFQMEIWR